MGGRGSHRARAARLLRRAVLPPLAASLLATGLAARPALAEPVVVRSGEHPGFSRLVFDFGVVPRWSLEADGTEWILAFAGPALRFDTDGVFDRIARRRVRQIDADLNRVVIDLGCDCRVSSYALAGGRLVVDISDKPDRDTVGVETGFAAPAVLDAQIGGEGEAQSQVAPDGASRGVAGAYAPAELRAAEAPVGETVVPGTVAARVPDRHPPALPLPGLPQDRADEAGRSPPSEPRPDRPEPRPRADATAADPRRTGYRSPGTPGIDSADLGLFDPSGAGHRTTAVVALTEALERAARQGLVDIERDAAPAEAAPSPPALALRQPQLPVGDSPGLRVTTSRDRDLGEIALRIADNAGSSCLAGHDIDVASWGGEDRGASVEIAALRGSLYGEFDAPDREAAAELVRRYIHFGFGAEAKAVLRAIPLPDDDAVLWFLAEIADGETRGPGDSAAMLLGCPGPAPLWGLLSIAAPPAGSVAVDEVVGAFSALPLHLRRLYGPVLIERFLALDDGDAARTVWEAVDRAPGPHGAAFDLATADLARAEGDVAAAERTYLSLGSASPGKASIAVVQLIRSRLARDAPMDHGLVDTAAALAFENRGTPLARDLKRAELEARIALGAWDDVFDELPRARFDGALTASDSDALLAALYVAMAERAQVSDFLTRGVEAAERLAVSTEADGARRALADRFLDLGLADRAEALLEDLVAPLPEDGLRRARVHLAAGRYGEVASLLGTDGSEAAARLRAEALLAEGRHGAAAEVFRSIGDGARAAEAAARSGDWDASSDPVRAAAAPLLEARSAELPDTPLARNRAIADDAGALRSEISALLEAAGAVAPEG